MNMVGSSKMLLPVGDRKISIIVPWRFGGRWPVGKALLASPCQRFYESIGG
jgi:hypothetical protein